MPTKKHLNASVPYRAFLVRCWQTETKALEILAEAADENASWSFVVVPVHDTTRAKGCNTWHELVEFLSAELARAPEPPKPPRDG